ncbi:MAG TPA: trypsin-like peptidase domain-containing protein, partial [Candidatus Udaeobacter sp.]|nr:trypsin-like peptidase domain-containing protein [Candidatus Udaeobacter sp.]
MSIKLRRRGWLAAGLAVVMGAAVIALVPQLGFSRTAPAQLWSDEPPKASGQTVQAPDWVAIAKALKPAVVNVSTKKMESGPSVPKGMDPDDPFSQFFRQFERRPHAVRSLGSGFIIHADGYIVSNNHVVDGASEIRVRLSDGRELPAKVLGRDPKTDLVLLKIEATGLPTIPVGDSSTLEAGAPVMAIGNPFGLAQTVTTGIVSGTGRVIGGGPYDDFIQTDASINPGNSGGPLINARGQAIGINAAIFSQSGGSIGIGFAIPVNLAKPVLTQLADSGRVVRG